jgi:hypothetical protein
LTPPPPLQRGKVGDNRSYKYNGIRNIDVVLLALFGANADFVIFSLLPAGGDHLGGVLEAGFVYGWASGSGFIKASKP